MSRTGLMHRLFLHAPVFLCILLLLTLAACSERISAQRAAPHPDAKIERIFVATERALDRTGPTFGEPRNPTLNFFSADISIPPTHVPGQVEWHDGPPDAQTDFVVTATNVIEGKQAFEREVRAHQTDNEVTIFVHGYNNTLSDVMFRVAQIQTDFDLGQSMVLYSWQSAGDPRGYIYDRDSVLYARDNLEMLLREMTDTQGLNVTLIAHSMGSHLIMEVMRQAALRGDRQLLSRISGVVLMSPDIDPDVFRRQAEVIGDLPDPFLIFISQADRALTLAGFITGRKPRLGVIDGPEAVEGLDVSVIDFTALSDGELGNHAVPTTSPTAISVLRGMMSQARSGQRAFEDYMVLTTQP